MSLTKNIKKDLGGGFALEMEIEAITTSVTLQVKKVIKKDGVATPISEGWINPSAHTYVQISDKATLDKVKKENPSLFTEIENKIKAELDALS